MAFKQFGLVCSDEDQGHPCSMPEVAQELFYNKNWMDDLLHCLFFIYFTVTYSIPMWKTL